MTPLELFQYIAAGGAGLAVAIVLIFVIVGTMLGRSR